MPNRMATGRCHGKVSTIVSSDQNENLVALQGKSNIVVCFVSHLDLLKQLHVDLTILFIGVPLYLTKINTGVLL